MTHARAVEAPPTAGDDPPDTLLSLRALCAMHAIPFDPRLLPLRGKHWELRSLLAALRFLGFAVRPVRCPAHEMHGRTFPLLAHMGAGEHAFVTHASQAEVFASWRGEPVAAVPLHRFAAYYEGEIVEVRQQREPPDPDARRLFGLRRFLPGWRKDAAGTSGLLSWGDTP